MRHCRISFFIPALATIVCMIATTVPAQTAGRGASVTPVIKVDCNKNGSIGATLAHLTQTGNTRGVNIAVVGTCKENVSIVGFDHLVIQGAPNATLQDASGGNTPVVGVAFSWDVWLVNLTINGGADGVSAYDVTLLTLQRCTVQGAVFDGMILERSHATAWNSSFIRNGFAGMRAEAGSNLNTGSNTITDNGREGMVLSNSYLNARQDTITRNAVGIAAFGGSNLRIADMTITDNISDGLQLARSATALFRSGQAGSLITGNGGNGVAIHDLSFASFASDVPDHINGNFAQPDVACYPQYSATRGAGSVGGITNCVEP